MRTLTLAGSGVVLLFPVLACATSPMHASPSEASSAPLLEVRLVLAESAEDGFPAEFEGEVLKLAHEPVISDPDFVTVRASIGQDPTGQDVLHLNVECTVEADARMRSISGQHVNRRMAILFDGEVRSAPVVRSAIGCSRITMGFPTSGGEAQRLAERVRTRWPGGS